MLLCKINKTLQSGCYTLLAISRALVENFLNSESTSKPC